ncbi:hypothetical protein ACIG87_25620 [Micromonospora sp. NPDC051925]|uniref:hypothetical protein n=1 Tax=Micromonospora sp. NPDC051925 TaxID=3364288 RepID=UPI0037CCA804
MGAEISHGIAGRNLDPSTRSAPRDVTYDEGRSQISAGAGPRVMAALRNAAINALHVIGIANIAAANRHRARGSTRPLALLGIT